MSRRMIDEGALNGMLGTALDNKQDKLTAGTNITIADDGTISASGGEAKLYLHYITGTNPNKGKIYIPITSTTPTPFTKEDLFKLAASVGGYLHLPAYGGNAYSSPSETYTAVQISENSIYAYQPYVVPTELNKNAPLVNPYAISINTITDTVVPMI